MPTLSENFSPNFQFRRSLLAAENSPSLRSTIGRPTPSQQPVRRCLFGDADDESRRRKTDQWLENRLAEIRRENRQKSLRYGFDFENERPLSEEENFELEEEGGKCRDYEWIGCSAESMPSFYSRPPAARPEKLQRVPSLNGYFSTPVKSSHKIQPIAQPAVQRKILTPARRNLTNSASCGAATPLSNHSETTSVFVRPQTQPQPKFVDLLQPIPAGQSETTPQKPPESSADDGKISPTFCDKISDVAATSSTINEKIAASKSSIQRRRRNIAQDDQSKMTNFFPLRKRCRRSTSSQQRLKMIGVGGDSNDEKTTTTYRSAAKKIAADHRPLCVTKTTTPTTGSTANTTTTPSSF